MQIVDGLNSIALRYWVCQIRVCIILLVSREFRASLSPIKMAWRF